MSSHPREESGRNKRIIAGLVLILAGLGLMAYFSRAPKPPVEVTRARLELRDGKLFLTNSADPFTGIMFEQYPDGKVQSRSMVKSGLLDGVSRGFYTNGQTQVEEHFSNGVSEGPRIKWYPSGAKMSEAAIHSGKIMGKFRRWHENGTLAEEVEMSNGVPHGTSISYYPSGYVKAEATLEKGKVLHQKFWKDGEGKRLNPAG